MSNAAGGSRPTSPVVETEQGMSKLLDGMENLATDDKTEEIVSQPASTTRFADQVPSVQSTPTKPAKKPVSQGKEGTQSMAAKLKAAKEAKAKDKATSSVSRDVSSSHIRAVRGSNIGSEQNEPAWTPQQLAAIAEAKRTVVEGEHVNDTRRSVPDPEGKYVITDESDTIRTRPAAYLPIIKPGDYKIGYGRAKADQKTGKSRVYSDIVMVGKDRSFVLNQWTIMEVVMEGVAINILDKVPRVGPSGRPERRIGHDFARIGLPALAVGPIFQTLAASLPGLLDDVTVTRGYYWLNASWGVTNSPGKFMYKAEDGEIMPITKLSDAMRRIAGGSSLGIATIAISLSDETTMQNNKPVPSGEKNMLSIKIHNMFHLRKVNYRSPPQASATGFEISDDIFSQAETLTSNATSTIFSNTQSSFETGPINPFGSSHLQNTAANNNADVTKFL